MIVLQIELSDAMILAVRSLLLYTLGEGVWVMCTIYAWVYRTEYDQFFWSPHDTMMRELVILWEKSKKRIKLLLFDSFFQISFSLLPPSLFISVSMRFSVILWRFIDIGRSLRNGEKREPESKIKCTEKREDSTNL